MRRRPLYANVALILGLSFHIDPPILRGPTAGSCGDRGLALRETPRSGPTCKILLPSLRLPGSVVHQVIRVNAAQTRCHIPPRSSAEGRLIRRGTHGGIDVGEEKEDLTGRCRGLATGEFGSTLHRRFFQSSHFAEFQRTELAKLPSGGFPMKRHIPYQQDLTVGLFAVMFVIMLLVVLASVPVINYLENFWFPGN